MRGKGDTSVRISRQQFFRLAEDREDAQLRGNVKRNALRRDVEKMRANAEVVFVWPVIV